MPATKGKVRHLLVLRSAILLAFFAGKSVAQDYGYTYYDDEYGDNAAPIDLPEECATYFNSEDSLKNLGQCRAYLEYIERQGNQGCPDSCRAFLKGVPETCAAYIPTTSLTWPQLYMHCGIIRGTTTRDPDKIFSGVNILPLIPSDCFFYYHSKEGTDALYYCKRDLLAIQSAGIIGCPDACRVFLQGNPEKCKRLPSTGLDLVKIDVHCGYSFGTPSPDVPSPDVNSPSPNTPAPPVDPSLSRTFTCDEGDGYQWIELDPDEASQWKEAGPDLGPEVAIVSKCTNFSEACCAVTAPIRQSWWQYNMGEKMKVKGVKLNPPTGTCCRDGDCTIEVTCGYEHLFSATINVGDFSLPDFYLSYAYRIALDFTKGDVSLAQPSVILALKADSFFCNVVNEPDFTIDKDSLLPSAQIGCGRGPLIGTGMYEPVGQYVTLSLPDGTPRSLALCGIEICAKKAY